MDLSSGFVNFFEQTYSQVINISFLFDLQIPTL